MAPTDTKWFPLEEVPLTLAFVRTGKTVARFIGAPVGTGSESGDRHRTRMWLNKVEEAALMLYEQQSTSSGFVLAAREYFDELRSRATAPSGVITDEDVSRAWNVYDQAIDHWEHDGADTCGLRRVLEDFITRLTPVGKQT